MHTFSTLLPLGALFLATLSSAFPAPAPELSRIGTNPNNVKRQRGVATYPATTTKASTTKASTFTKASTSTRTSTGAVALAATASPTAGSVQQLALSAHNSFRAQHGAQPLAWNTTLASAAQTWANKCVFQHSNGALGPWGENLAALTGSNTITAGIKMWTDESVDYTPATPNYSHFTQVVWKATTQVGCAVASCNGIFPAAYGPANYYVCEYNPRGNVYPASNFAANVQP